MEQEPSQSQENQDETVSVEIPETGIPEVDWGLRIQREIDETTDPERKQELQDFKEKYWAGMKLIGLYE